MTFRRTCLLVLLCWTAAPLQARPWGATGHMITARIAYSLLDDDVRLRVDSLIAVLAEADPNGNDFVTASLWMDAVRGRGLRLFNQWHYTNGPINPSGLPDVPGPRDENAVWALDQTVRTLRDEDAGAFEQALALRLLIHLVGDIHQPLHCVSRFTTGHPEGDLGGNLFPLPFEWPNANLHGFWDNTAGLFPYVPPRSDDAPERIAAFAEVITAAVPRDSLAVGLDFQPSAWANEGYDLAVTVVYDGLAENTPPSEAYLDRAHAAIRIRLALAGYRLAAVLNDVLETGSAAR